MVSIISHRSLGEKPGSGPGARGYDQPKKQPDFWHRRILLNKALFVAHAYVVSIARFSGQAGRADAAPGGEGGAGVDVCGDRSAGGGEC
jgi:hypothetical protein